MRVFAISDLHLSNAVNKPMNIFGEKWEGHWDKIKDDWNSKVNDDDLVLIAGDISWAMNTKDAMSDLIDIDCQKGRKVIIRGNHDYWWESIKKLRDLPLNNITFIQNDAYKFGNNIICGTRGWTVPENGKVLLAEDKKIYDRELIRLKLTLDTALKLKTSNENILVMLHYPPFNSTFDNSDFTEIISYYKVDKVIYGHLHGSNARFKTEVYKNNIPYYLTSCDLLDNKLIELS